MAYSSLMHPAWVGTWVDAFRAILPCDYCGLTMEMSRERHPERRHRANGVRRLLQFGGLAGTPVVFPIANSYH